MTSAPNPILAEIMQTFGTIAYTHKTQEKEAERKESAGKAVKIANVIVIAVTVGLTLAAPLMDSAWAAWLAVASGVVGLAFTLFQLSFDPAGDATRHRLAAKSYLALRNDYRRLIADVQAGVLSGEDVRARRRVLADELVHVERTAPPTSQEAYQDARTALQGTEELTFTDQEYRHLLGPLS